MRTSHRIHLGDAADLGHLDDGSVRLVVTSPPYPMIEMWDEVFRAQAPEAGRALDRNLGPAAFEAMHTVLDAVWAECFRVLAPGGLCCINIGDATRTIGGRFQLYPNHARILSAAQALGFTPLPDILWRKPTNSPNKFMGSGMLPAGAYVTYEHEYVLILRKGGKREFPDAEQKALRRRSAYFWEERNVWFSDLWEGLTGTRQRLVEPALRERSAAYPLALPLRLISMFSVYGDVVLDPFAGTGTTTLAAAMTGRSSQAVELDPALVDGFGELLTRVPDLGRKRVAARLAAHTEFVAARQAQGRTLKHHNRAHDVPVVTGQERDLELLVPAGVAARGELQWLVSHAAAGARGVVAPSLAPASAPGPGEQEKLFGP